LNDFRCSIAQDIADDLFTTYKQQARAIIDSIAVEQSQRMVEVMESISHCCDFDEVRKTMPQGHDEVTYKRRKIYDTTIQKALEMCESFKRFNLKNDSGLEQARTSLEKVLRGVKAEDIRDSDAVRHHVKEGIDDILSKFGSFNSI
jgi:hypothetical protein